MEIDHIAAKAAADKAARIRAFQRAVVLLGGQRELADALTTVLGRPIRQQHVSLWIKNGSKLDAGYWPAFAQVTGGEIGGPQLRPDLPFDAVAPLTRVAGAVTHA